MKTFLITLSIFSIYILTVNFTTVDIVVDKETKMVIEVDGQNTYRELSKFDLENNIIWR